MSITITLIINKDGKGQCLEFEAEEISSMDEIVALASSMGPVPDPPFTITCGPNTIYDTATPSTGSLTLSVLGITRNATFILNTPNTPSPLPGKRTTTTQEIEQHQPPQKQPSSPPQKPQLTAEDVLQAIQMNTSKQPQPPSQPQRNTNGGIITADDVLKAFNKKPGSLFTSPPSPPQQHQGARPHKKDGLIKTADEFIRFVKANPAILENISLKAPEFADAILCDKKEIVQEYLNAMNKRIEFERKVKENPFDPEVQKEIEESIRRENVSKNLKETYDENPELLLGVTSPHIRCKINGVEVIGLVDTGAQVSVMSPQIAKKCNLTWLIDTRVKGIMKGVGQTMSVGRIHGTMIELEGIALKCSLTIIDSNADFIFGCDQLRRHRCVIDLDKNVLRIGSVEVPFVAEKDLPRKEIADISDDDDDDGATKK